jgi:hypothetical protein
MRCVEEALGDPRAAVRRRRNVTRVTAAIGVLGLLPCVGPAQDIRLRSTAPVVTITSTVAGGDSVLFGGVINATRLGDGTIVVADPFTPALLYFDRAAHLLVRAARRGGGPGEFGRIGWMGQCARDTIFAFEQARIEVFSSRGRYLRTIETGGHLPGQLFCGPTGAIAAVGAGNWGLPGASGVRRITAAAWLFGTDGTLVRDLGDVPVTDAAWDGANWTPVPLGRQMFMTVDGADVILGAAESALLSTSSRSGGWAPGPSLGTLATRDPTDEELDAGVLGLLALAPNRHAKALHDMLLRLPRPKGMPAYNRLLADGAGRVWAQLSVVGLAPTRLRWVDRRTGRTGDLEIPAALTVQEVGRGYLLAIEELPSGEQRVVEYALSGS